MCLFDAEKINEKKFDGIRSRRIVRGMTSKQITQITAQLSMISVSLSDMNLIRSDKSTLDVKGMRFGKHEERFTVALDSKGNVKKGSVRFYGSREAELN
jgi:hypothetical protein